MNSKIGIQTSKAKLDMYWDKAWDYKLNLDVSGRPLLAPIYRWPGLEDPVGFDTDPSYMMVYNTTSLFDYDYISTSFLGLCFYEPLLEQTSGVLIQQALVVISLSITYKHFSSSVSTGTLHQWQSLLENIGRAKYFEEKMAGRNRIIQKLWNIATPSNSD
jgi:hypothetical protein